TGNVIEMPVRDGDRRITDDVVGSAPEFEQRAKSWELVEGFVARDRDSLDGDSRRLDANPPAAVGIILPHGRRLFQACSEGQKSRATAASTSTQASTAEIERNMRSVMSCPPCRHVSSPTLVPPHAEGTSTRVRRMT